MDRQGTIFSRTPVVTKKTNEGLHRDSGVGQAPESLYQPSFFKELKSLQKNKLSSWIYSIKFVFGQKSGKKSEQSRELKADTSSFIQLGQTHAKNKNAHRSSPKSGTVYLAQPANIWQRRVGTALIVFSILGFTLTYGPIIKTELSYRLSQILGSKSEQKGSFGEILAQMLPTDISQIPDPNFSLIIPKIHASSRVVPNVDPGNEAEYMAALKQGVAHAKGTYFPGGAGTVYLFAHSTDSPLNIVRYNAVFYLLRELENGDEVMVYFTGVKHRYQVIDKKIVEPTDTTYLMPQNPLKKELLILQTCWPPGTRFKRLLIFAEKVETSPTIPET